MLCRDSSVFNDIFKLPKFVKRNEESMGLSDERPLILGGDTVDQFRGLLWLLQALSVSHLCIFLMDNLHFSQST